MSRRFRPTDAFVDESIRGQRYLMGCVLVEARHVTEVRAEVSSLVLTGGRVHFHNESAGRRRALLDRFAALPHIVPTLHGEFSSFVDVALEAQGLRRRSILATAHFLGIPLLLKAVPAIATLPLRLSQQCANAAALSASPLPFVAPRFDVSMLWHRRDTPVAAHRWLRERLMAHNPAEPRHAGGA